MTNVSKIALYFCYNRSQRELPTDAVLGRGLDFLRCFLVHSM